MTDLAAIRARHDVFETYLQQMPHHAAAVTLDLRVRTLHADRGALLDALDAKTAQWRDVLEAEHALSAAYVRLRVILRALDPPLGDSIWAHTEEAARQIVAALDRLAAVTVEEVARHLAEWTLDGTVTRIERDMADSVLGLIRERVKAR